MTLLAARIEELVQLLESEHGKGDLLFVAVVCNGCEKRVQAPNVAELLPCLDGWQIERPVDGVGRDYCKDCVGVHGWTTTN